MEQLEPHLNLKSIRTRIREQVPKERIDPNESKHERTDIRQPVPKTKTTGFQVLQ